MTKTRTALALVLFTAASGAQAQTYGQPPLYPYAQQQPYAVEVAPNTYVIQRPAPIGNYPYITCVNCSRNSSAVPVAQSAPRRPRQSADRGLIEELRKHNEAKQLAQQPVEPAAEPTVTTTKKVLREKPIVHETVCVVDDPPRVIERRHVVVDTPLPPRRLPTQAAVEDEVTGNTNLAPDNKTQDNKVRVIRAEAEVTILGPDRMTNPPVPQGQRAGGEGATGRIIQSA
jgi:hypothetical protein